MSTENDYIPELDYKASNYQPFGGRKSHFCTDCIAYYKTLYEKGITKSEFPFHYKNKHGQYVQECSYDRRLVLEDIRRSDFATDEDYETAKTVADPVTWAYAELGWKPRWYQEEILCCSAQSKAVRAGRRIGKTEALATYIVWRMVTGKRFKVLIICPYVPQVDLIFDMIRTHIAKSPSIQNSVVRDVHSPPQCIELANGSIARGFGVGGSATGDSAKIRGQGAHLIVVDECDFISDSDLEVIMAIKASNRDTEMVVSSTPTGQRGRLFEWTRNKDDRWKEFWYISAESPEWKPEVEAQYRSYYSQGGFAREFLAEFGDLAEGIFSDSALNKSIQRYDYEQCLPDHQNCTYTMGVDWNKITGTHIVIIERPKAGDIYYKVVAKKIIRRSEFTQIEGVRAILDLDGYWHPAFVYCDAGYGTVQMEMIYKEGEKQPMRRYKERFRSIDMGSNTEIIQPGTNMLIKRPTKAFMVYEAQRQVQRGFCIFPKSEDTNARILPEEIPYADVGIVQQARGFKVEKVSATGREIFSNEYEHTLTAWMLAVFANLMEFGDYRKLNLSHDVAHVAHPGTEMPQDKVSIFFNEMGERRSPSEIHQAMMAEARRRKTDQDDQKERVASVKRGNINDPVTDDVPEIKPGTKEILVSRDGKTVQSARFASFRERRSGLIRKTFRRGGWQGRGRSGGRGL